MLPSAKETKLTKFEKSKCLKVSVLKEHREISLRLNLTKGRYIIVPSTRSPGQTGDFFLSLYFNCDLTSMNIKRLDKQGEKYTMISQKSENHKASDWKIKLVTAR